MGKTLSILIVEDDEDDFILLRECLKSVDEMAFAVDWAQAYDQGIQKISSGAYDIVFLDFFLGARNALELLLELDGKPASTEFILITGHPKLPCINEVIRAGASGWLSKVELNKYTLMSAIQFAMVYKHQ